MRVREARMTVIITAERRGRDPRNGERGAALFIALVLVIIMTFLGFGLLTRTLLVARIAGSERWSTKAFYAADAGIASAKARLRIRQTIAFTFPVSDLRGAQGQRDAGQIQVAVSNLDNVGAPQPVIGSQIGGVQGGTETLVVMFYKGTSTAQQALTRSERQVMATMAMGPVPPVIPDL